MNYLGNFFTAAILSLLAGLFAIYFCRYYKILSRPTRKRDVHSRPIPRVGGAALFLSFFAVVSGTLLSEELNLPTNYLWLILGAFLVLIVGLIDDIKPIHFSWKLLAQILAGVCVLLAGLKIEFLRLPNSVLYFENWSYLVTILWVILIINVVNFLDGLDGLAAGVCLLSFLALFFLTRNLGQASVALLAMIAIGTLAGFLPLNFYPARIFLGDSGSYFIGYLLAVLAILGGGKVATASLVLGLAIFDALWVILRRLFLKKSPFAADRFHIHHRLLDLGLQQWQAVLLLYALTFFLMLASITTNSIEKMRFFQLIFVGMVVLAILLTIFEHYYGRKNLQKN